MGDLFILAGKLTRPQVEQVIALQENSQLRFGEAALQLGLLSKTDIQSVLAHQFNYTTATNTLDGQVLSQLLPIALEPYGAEAEAIRRIRSELLLQKTGEGALRLAVLSPRAKEGRSYVAANLAIAFSQLGKRTLLIDADLRTPSIHTYFNATNKHGLSTALAGRSDLGLDTVMQVLPDLWLLTAGPLPPNPLEILRDPNFDNLLALVANEIDVLIVDTPPALDSSDAKLIARQVGGALLVGRQHHSLLSELQRTTNELKSVGVNLLGSVYNQHPVDIPALNQFALITRLLPVRLRGRLQNFLDKLRKK